MPSLQISLLWQRLIQVAVLHFDFYSGRVLFLSVNVLSCIFSQPRCFYYVSAIHLVNKVVCVCTGTVLRMK